MTKIQLPYGRIPGSDKPNSAEAAIQANFDALKATFAAERTQNSGTATLSWVANNDASVTVAHGLPGIPNQVVFGARTAGSASIREPACTARTATQITIEARTGDGLNTTMDIDIDWVAIL